MVMSGVIVALLVQRNVRGANVITLASEVHWMC